MQRNRAVDSFNADLKLLRNIAAHQPQIDWPKPKNIAQLATLLKHKNPPNQYNSDQVEKGRSWLRKKGIDIEAIYSRLQTRPEAPLQPHPQDSYFYVSLTPDNIPEYLQKSYEYSTMSLSQHVMSTQQRGRFISRAVGMLTGQGQKRFKVSWEGQRIPEQRDTYLRLVRGVVGKNKERNHALRELLGELKTAFTQYKELSFWEILGSQLERYVSGGDPTENQAAMLQASLRLVQGEFQRRLHGQDFQRYLAVNYLQRMLGRSHQPKETVWGKIWLSMMAGLHKQSLELISHRHKNYADLMNAYTKSQEAISTGTPIICRLQHRPDIKDAFYDQVIFCLNAEPKYSNQALCEPQSLEMVWLALRTAGIYPLTEKNAKFGQLREGIVGGYRDCSYNSQLVRNMLYLLDYEAVVKLGPNVLMNKDDYLHFLLVLAAFPTLAPPALDRLLLEKLTETIVQLMVEGREEYVSYIALLPPQSVVAQVSPIIVSSDALDSFRWSTLKGLIPSSLFTSLATTAISQFVCVRGDYLKAAEKVLDLTGDASLAVDYLTTMLVRHYLHTQTFPSEQVSRAEEMGLRLSGDLDALHSRIFELFSSVRKLGGLLVTRETGALQQFISNNDLIFLDNRAICSFIGVLERLADYGGIEVYFQFLRDTVKAAEICTLRAGRTEEMRNFKALLLSTCHRLLESQKLTAFSSEPGVTALMDYLREPY